MTKTITTEQAPQAIGPYSQAVQVNNLVFISGQIGLDPETGQLVSEDFRKQAQQVFKNFQSVVQAAQSNLAEVVKLTVYLVDLSQFAGLNEIMSQYFKAPYPARAAVEVSALPKGAQIEIEGIVAVDQASSSESASI